MNEQLIIPYITLTLITLYFFYNIIFSERDMLTGQLGSQWSTLLVCSWTLFILTEISVSFLRSTILSGLCRFIYMLIPPASFLLIIALGVSIVRECNRLFHQTDMVKRRDQIRQLGLSSTFVAMFILLSGVTWIKAAS